MPSRVPTSFLTTIEPLKRIFILALLAASACSQSQPATTGGQTFLQTRQVPDRLDHLKGADNAPTIVVGTVTALKAVPYTNEFGDQLIATEATVKIERVVRGDQQPGTDLIVTFMGGKLGNSEMRAEHWRIPTVGERVRLFLSRRGTRWMPVNGEAGTRKE